jgi:hypothetical protein
LFRRSYTKNKDKAPGHVRYLQLSGGDRHLPVQAISLSERN